MSIDSRIEKELFGLSQDEVRHEPGTPRKKLVWYAVSLCLGPFAIMAAAYLWMSTGTYARHSANTYLRQLGYGLTLQNADCQILIYGDSTAMVGVDPEEIKRETGMTACNIAEYAGIQVLNGNYVLDEYLKHNPRPKVLIFLYAPENYSHLQDPSKAHVSLSEGTVLMLEHRPGAFLPALLHNPLTMLENGEVGLRTGVISLSKHVHEDATHSRAEHRGRLVDTSPPLAECSAEQPERAPDLRWMQSLRSKYGIGGTQVLLAVTPLPPCDPSLNYYRRMLPDAALNLPLAIMPTYLYSTSGRLHTGEAGAKEISDRLGALVRSELHAEGTR